MINTEDPRIVRFPHPTKLHVDYSKMQVGDVWGTTSNAPVSVGIKIKTWGALSAFSLAKCSHVAVVCKIDAQFFLVEAIGSGVQISTCYKYLDPRFSNLDSQACWIGRHSNIRTGHLDFLNFQLLCMAFDSPDYDFCGTGRFAVPFLRQSPAKLFCSELADTALRATDESLAILPRHRSWEIVPAYYQRCYLMEVLTKKILAR